MGIEKIGRYKVIGELGKGAMGVVYKAQDPTIGRIVALKTMRVDAAGIEAQEMLARFRNEARAAGLLNHPNIITIYDAGEHEGLFYIAMEVLEGESLQHKLKQQRVLSPDEIASIGSQICAGLDYAHGKGVIHRDIKPANVMILPDGTVKIMDFGIAKAGAAHLTTTGQVVGTPNYMSPEQVRGKPLDGRTDLFSLGVMLYEMITGERPFTGENVTTIVYKIVNEHPPEPRALDVTVHPGLNAVVVKALAKSPDQRYQSGAELAQDLQNFRSLGLEPTAATVLADTSQMAAMAAAARTRGTATGQRPASSGGMSALASQAAPIPVAQPSSVPAPAGAAQETVSAPQRAAPVQEKKSRAVAPAIIAIVSVALLAGGLYVRSRRSRSGTPPAPQQPVASQNPIQTAPATPVPSAQPQTNASAGNEAAKAGAPETAGDTGELLVTSAPDGASIRLDGRSAAKWTTPFTFANVKAGSHTIVISKDGFKPETQKIEVEAGGRANVSAELRPAQASFAITSDPPGANIFLDGKAIGKVTPTTIEVTPGQHNVGLLLEGYRGERIVADAGAGQTLNLSRSLKPQEGAGARPFGRLRRFFGASPEEKGFLEIRTRPRGAEIWIGNMQAPMKTPARVPIPAGNYRITLRMPGFKPVTRSVTVEKGKTYGIEEILERQ